jgi:hypothetical protein
VNYQKSDSNITFKYTHEGYNSENFSFPITEVVHKIDGESNLSEVIQAFENFLLGCGYCLNKGEKIGIIEE